MWTRIKAYLYRAVRYVLKGEPQVFVKVDSVLKGDLLEGKNIIITGQVVVSVMKQLRNVY